MGKLPLVIHASLAVFNDKADVTDVSQWWLLLAKEFYASQNLS
jgi:hypothetical protein